MNCKIFYSLFVSFITFHFIISSSAYAQCLEEGQVFLPETHIANADLYGDPVIGFENNLLVSSPNSDQYEFNGGIVYLYQIDSGNWTKQAEFKPSEHHLQMVFGRKTAIDKNIIIIAGNTNTPEGYQFDELFVYTKNNGEEWTSKTESYKVTLNKGTDNLGLVVNKMVINNDILGVSYRSFFENIIAFYRINPDLTLEYITTLNRGGDFDFTDNVLAVGGTYMDEISIRGAVYAYDLKKVLDGSDHEPLALLRPAADEEHQGFGSQVEVDSGYIYAANEYNYSDPTQYKAEIFIFKKPETGWVDSFESAKLSTDSTNFPGYIHSLEVSGQYVFFSEQYSKNKFYIFKKDGEWQDATADLIIIKERDNENDKRHYALDYAVLDNHLVINYLSNYIYSGPDNQDKLISYYAPGGEFEKITTPHQELSEPYYTATESNFGKRISYDNDWIAIGSPGNGLTSGYAGAAYVYNKNDTSDSFDLSAVIRPPDASRHSNFGFSVELSDTLLFISSMSYGSLNSNGSSFDDPIAIVYLYVLEGMQWVLKNTLHSPVDIPAFDVKNFGGSLSYDSGYLAVSHNDTGQSKSNGRVFIFRFRENYQLEYVATMMTKDQQGGDLFGSNILLRGDLLVVGTGNREGYYDEMKVYIFQKEGVEWISKTEDAYLSPSDKHRSDRFGFSIDMNHDLIVVGSPGFNYGDSKDYAGKAYVFQRPEDGWNGRIEESLTLEPKEPKQEDFFGYSVDIDENNIVIGAASTIFNTYHWKSLLPGKVFFFDPFSEKDKLVQKRNERFIQLSENSRYLDGFGYDLEGANDRMFVSAIYDNNSSGFRAGAVYELKYSTYINKVEKPICRITNPFNLKSNRPGGYWSGEGVADSLTGLFDPSLVSQYGWTLVNYNVGDCRVSTSIYIGSLATITSRSDDETNKCEGDKINLFVDYTSDTQSATKWYHKANIGNNFEFIGSGTDTLEIIEPGLYKVEILTGLCQPVIAEFIVNDYKNDANLNYHDYVEVCAYEEKNLILAGDSEIQNISWFFKASDTSQYSVIETDNTVPLNKSGYYYTTYTIGPCTFISDTVEVYFNRQDLTLEGPDMICESSEFQLNATPKGGIWSGMEISDEGLVYVQNLSNQTYYASYALPNSNCVFKDSVQFEILVMDKPQVQFTSTEVCPGQPVELVILNNSYNAQVSWYKTGVNDVIFTSENFSIDKPGEYFAQFSLKSCKKNSDSLMLSIKRDSLFAPNVVTVNNDGANDEFTIYHSGTVNLKLSIVDRWGKMIYRDDDEQILWKPDNFPAGIYYWHIQYLDCFEEINSRKGWLQVMKERAE